MGIVAVVASLRLVVPAADVRGVALYLPGLLRAASRRRVRLLTHTLPVAVSAPRGNSARLVRSCGALFCVRVPLGENVHISRMLTFWGGLEGFPPVRAARTFCRWLSGPQERSDRISAVARSGAERRGSPPRSIPGNFLAIQFSLNEYISLLNISLRPGQLRQVVTKSLRVSRQEAPNAARPHRCPCLLLGLSTGA